MVMLAIVGGLLLVLAFCLREIQLMRERAALTRAVEHLRAALDTTRQQARRLSEDVYVLASVLIERNLVDDTELARGRARLIEQPRRLAEERQSLARDMHVAPNQLVIEDGEPKIH